MKKRLIIATAVAVVLLIAFMGIGGFAQVTEDVTVTATFSPTINFSMTPTAINFGAIVPTDPATIETETSAVAVKSNTLWTFTLTTAPDLTGAVEAVVIDDTYFTFLQNNESAGVTLDVASGGFQANEGVQLANGTRGVESWDFNFQLSKDFAIPADAYAFPGVETQVYTVAAI